MTLEKKIYIIAAVLGTIILIIILFPVRFLFEEIKKNSRELIEAKKELVAFESEIQALENFREIYKNYQPNLEKADQLFIDSKVPIDFIQFLEKTADLTGISIEISPSTLSLAETKNDPWPSAGFKISSAGLFSNSLKFLEKIESSPYLIEIQNLNLEKLDSDNIRATFLIKVFTR